MVNLWLVSASNYDMTRVVEYCRIWYLLMSPTKWLSVTFYLQSMQTFKCHFKVWAASNLLRCEASSNVILWGTQAKIKPCNALLYWLADLACVAHVHILLQSETQLQNSIHLVSFATESWLVCGYASLRLPHENTSVLTVAGIKHMYSSQGCNSLTVREDPGYRSSAIAYKSSQYACSSTVFEIIPVV